MRPPCFWYSAAAQTVPVIADPTRLWLWFSLKAVELVNLTSATLAEVIAQAHQGIQRIRGTPQLAYPYLRHTGPSVS